MSRLQGNLQSLFDALYELGVIDPVLQSSWRDGLEEVERRSPELLKAIEIVNTCGGDIELLYSSLAKLDPQTLEILAMEVAREYADFHSRSSTLH